MLTKNINFKNFRLNKNNLKVKKDFKILMEEKNPVIESLGVFYKNSYNNKLISTFKNLKNFKVIGMGGSILGTESIYDFLKHKIKKKFFFYNNLQPIIKLKKQKKSLNLIVSKSGNTLETISNTNIILKKKDKNIFITENKKSYLLSLAQKLKSEIVHHNNFIGGRYSVLSEVGMLPAELMGLNIKNFKQMNNLIKNKKFIDSLTENVSNTLFLIKQKKFNSIILNYDEKSENLFNWYQQLVAESLGKKGKGILPVVSSMPKDNHSLMQLYLDGPNKYFYTFFNVLENKDIKIKNGGLLNTHKFLKNLSIEKIKQSQMIATEKVFISKKIPFRSFRVLKRNEQSLGELFCFFILETILLGRALNVNPFDQPSVELIKIETKKILS